MQFRIIAGPRDLDAQTGVNSLKTLYKSPKLLIQGSEDIQAIHLDDGRQAFLAGNVLGIQTAMSEITPCCYASGNLKGRYKQLVGMEAKCRMIEHAFEIVV